MNKFILMGRLTKDPDVGRKEEMVYSRFDIAVDRRIKKEGQATADFFRITAFGKLAEFTEKYLHKGIKVLVEGYEKNDPVYETESGEKRYSNSKVAERIEFCESKKAAGSTGAEDDFQDVTDTDDEVPWN